jgi:hypothetical protein
MFCSTLGAGAVVLSPPDGGGGGAAEAGTAGDITPKLALLLSDATPPLLAPSSGKSNIISSLKVQGFLPGVPVEPVLEEEGGDDVDVGRRGGRRGRVGGGRTCSPSAQRG